MSCACHEGRIVGVISTELWRSTDSLAWNKLIPADQQISTDGPAMLIGDLAVISAFRRRGIANALLERVIADSKYDEATLLSLGCLRFLGLRLGAPLVHPMAYS